jgi:membrane protein DedA with SNARE-associated domain
MIIEHWFSGFDDWARTHADLVVPAAFIVAFLESFPLVSILVPGTALLLALGALVGAGLVEPAPVLVAAIIGAVLGDTIGFWVSRHVGAYAIRRRLPVGYRRIYARAVLMFRRYGFWAVFGGRFVGPVRAIVPIAAGVAGMPQARFQLANILSAIAWAPVCLMPGYVGGWIATLIGNDPDPRLLVLLAFAAVIGWVALRWVVANLRRRALG